VNLKDKNMKSFLSSLKFWCDPNLYRLPQI